MTVISGETGAGKSLLAGCPGLLSGQRARAELIGPHGDECVVTAAIEYAQAVELLEQHGLALSQNQLRKFYCGAALIERDEVSAGLMISQLRLVSWLP